jgi:hypothetical protein
MSTNSETSIGKLILIPSLITLAITLLRLLGELQNWPTSLFNPAAGGGGAIIGISWLPPIFGFYFARKLLKAGETPISAGKVILGVLLGIVLMVLGGFVGFAPQLQFPGKIFLGLLLMVAGGVAPFFAWRKLYKVLLAYGLAARIPVAILMFFAIRGNWGTHYDVPPPGFVETDWFSKYIQIGLIPQIFLWIPYTILTGTLIAGITAAIMHRSKAAKPLEAKA